MLAIRLQRVGRKGHAQYRIIAQDSQRSPTSGRVVAALGHYDPHTKEITVDAKQTQHYLDNGAQPSDRVVALLKKQKDVKLPAWVDADTSSTKRTIKNPTKLRKNQPKEEAPAEVESQPTEADESGESGEANAPADDTTEEKADA